MSSASVRLDQPPDPVQTVGAVHREAPRRDEGSAIQILDRLAVTEGVQVLDVPAALPDAAAVSRYDEAAGGGELGLGLQDAPQLPDRIRGQRRIGVEDHRQRRRHQAKGERLGARLRAGVLRRTDHLRTGGRRQPTGLIGRAVVDHDHDIGRIGLREDRPHRVLDRFRLVVGRNDAGQRQSRRGGGRVRRARRFHRRRQGRRRPHEAHAGPEIVASRDMSADCSRIHGRQNSKRT